MMNSPLPDNYMKLLKELEQLDERVVKKLERIGYSDGWVERKRKGNAIREMLVKAKVELQNGKTENIQEWLGKLAELGINISIK